MEFCPLEVVGEDDDILIELLAEVYGLISGPSWLRQSLVADFEAMGYRRNPYDKCLMTLPPLPGKAGSDEECT